MRRTLIALLLVGLFASSSSAQYFTAEQIDDPKTVVTDSLGAYWDSTEVAAHLLDVVVGASWTITPPTGTTGSFFAGNAGPIWGTTVWSMDTDASKTLATANSPHGHHAVLICNTAVKEDSVRVFGTTLPPGDLWGTAAALDTTYIVMAASDSAGTYYETPEKYTGTVTFERVTGALNARQVRWGLISYWDNGNQDFDVRSIMISGQAGANDTGFNFKFRVVRPYGWTWDGVSTVSDSAWPTLLGKWNDVYTGSNGDLISGEDFRQKQVVHADSTMIVLGSANVSGEVAPCG